MAEEQQQQQIEVDASEVLQELVNNGVVTQATMNMAVNTVALRMQYRSLMKENEDLKLSISSSKKDE